MTVRGAREHNLQGRRRRPSRSGCLVAVTGVSGSGKSTLVNDILLRSLAQHLHRAKAVPGRHRKVEGMANLDKVIDVDQAPIGRTPRSNPATYTGVFDHIRKLFAQTAEAKVRGYQPGRFSFNVRGGRCEACAGDGTIKIEMHFLPDVYVPCEVCHGARYNRDTLEITFRGKTIADVLDMSVRGGARASSPTSRRSPATCRPWSTSASATSGWASRRRRCPAARRSGSSWPRELSRRPTGHTLYILDEPTTGLHFEDIRKLLEVLNRLVDQGNTVVVIEHNLDVIKTADWIIDLGPEGGDGRHRRRRGHARAGGQDGGQLHRRGAQAGAGQGQVTASARSVGLRRRGTEHTPPGKSDRGDSEHEEQRRLNALKSPEPTVRLVRDQLMEPVSGQTPAVDAGTLQERGAALGREPQDRETRPEIHAVTIHEARREDPRARW